jgi:hypothetical protein
VNHTMAMARPDYPLPGGTVNATLTIQPAPLAAPASVVPATAIPAAATAPKEGKN